MNEILNLLYNSEEYFFYHENSLKDFFDYLQQLYNSSLPEDVNYLIQNHKIKFDVFKTLSYNNLWVKYSPNLYKDILLFLLIREHTRYDIGISQPTINVVLDGSENIIDTQLLEKVSNTTSNLLFNKRIIIDERTVFDDKSINNFHNNCYDIIFKTASINTIKSSYKVLLLINDTNIDDIHNLISHYRDMVGVTTIELELQAHCSVDTNNKYRTFTNNKLLFENTYNCVIRNKDLLPCEHLLIDSNYISNYTNKGFKNSKQIVKNSCITSIIQELKLDVIDNLYINKECMNCHNNILCVLGQSNNQCEYKI